MRGSTSDARGRQTGVRQPKRGARRRSRSAVFYDFPTSSGSRAAKQPTQFPAPGRELRAVRKLAGIHRAEREDQQDAIDRRRDLRPSKVPTAPGRPARSRAQRGTGKSQGERPVLFALTTLNGEERGERPTTERACALSARPQLLSFLFSSPPSLAQGVRDVVFIILFSFSIAQLAGERAPPARDHSAGAKRKRASWAGPLLPTWG